MDHSRGIYGGRRMRGSSCFRRSRSVVLIVMLLFTAACEGGLPGLAAPTPTPKPVEPLVFYNWGEYLPQSLLDSFTAQTGIPIEEVSYDDYGEAAIKIQQGEIYDVVLLTPEQVLNLSRDNHLARLEAEAIPNKQNISPDFRNWSYDPGNMYSVPLVWGSSGLLVRTDRVSKPVTRWADLWDSAYAGKVVIWPIADTMLPIALKALGYSANAEDPAALEAALQHLLALKPASILVPSSTETVVPLLESGEAVIAVGWALDALYAQANHAPIEYVLPEEGSLLWVEVLSIPATSRHKAAAEQFINFMLSAEVAAQLPGLMGYAVPNDAAKALIPADILGNAIIFPPLESIHNAEMGLPHSPAGKRAFDDAWRRFLEAP